MTEPTKIDSKDVEKILIAIRHINDEISTRMDLDLTIGQMKVYRVGKIIRCDVEVYD